MTKIVVLTGGIGAGKTTVEEIFSSLGVETLDADKITNNLLDKNTKAYKKIVEIFDLEPGSLDSVCSVNRDIIAAVEMNKGWFAKNRIELFSRIALP